MKELAGGVDPNDYGDSDKDIGSSVPAVDAGSISWRQEIRKEIIEKHENPADVVRMSDTLQVMDKVIRFSYQFDNEELRESIVKVLVSSFLLFTFVIPSFLASWVVFGSEK